MHFGREGKLTFGNIDLLAHDVDELCQGTAKKVTESSPRIPKGNVTFRPSNKSKTTRDVRKDAAFNNKE